VFYKQENRIYYLLFLVYCKKLVDHTAWLVNCFLWEVRVLCYAPFYVGAEYGLLDGISEGFAVVQESDAM